MTFMLHRFKFFLNLIEGIMLNTHKDLKVQARGHEGRVVCLKASRLSKVLLVFGVLLIVLSGYFMTYALFLENINIEKLGSVTGDHRQVDFRYDGVAYFHGYELLHDSKWELSYFAPWVMELMGAEIELFIEVPGTHDEESDVSIGRLKVNHPKTGSVQRISIKSSRHQRILMDWSPKSLATNKVVIKYSAIPGYENIQVNFGAVVASNGIYKYAFWSLVLGCAFIFRSDWLRSKAKKQPRKTKHIIVLLFLAGAAFYVHSGAFISQEFFSERESRVTSGMSRQLNYLLKHGSFSEINYRNVGATIIPMGVCLIEGGSHALKKSFQDVYPTSRYLMFVLFSMSILFLGSSLRCLNGRMVGFLFILLAVTFFPFIADLYNPDADAMLLFLFPLFLAFLLRARYGIGAFWPNITGVLVVFFVIGLTKITAVFLILAAPLLFLFPVHRIDLKRIIVIVCFGLALLSVFVAGKNTSDALQHDNRNVGIEGVPFQDTVAWHMVWAAYGVYDHHSAHWFTKSGRLRNQRVAEATGLPNMTYIRHSQLATEKLYKPAVLRALEERPGYFYSTAFLRLYNHGAKFYRYTYGEDKEVWTRWLKDGFTESEVISGEEVFGLHPERQSIRYDDAWKISPLIFLAKATQGDITRLVDIILLFAALLGLLLTRHRGLAVFLVLCWLAQIFFSSGIHGINRYYMFCSVALLIGLSTIISRIVHLLFQVSEK